MYNFFLYSSSMKKLLLLHPIYAVVRKGISRRFSGSSVTLFYFLKKLIRNSILGMLSHVESVYLTSGYFSPL
jgi:hypothetical protein